MSNWNPRRRGERENTAEAIFEELITENFPKFTKIIKPEIQKVLQTPSQINRHDSKTSVVLPKTQKKIFNGGTKKRQIILDDAAVKTKNLHAVGN